MNQAHNSQESEIFAVTQEIPEDALAGKKHEKETKYACVGEQKQRPILKCSISPRSMKGVFSPPVKDLTTPRIAREGDLAVTAGTVFSL